MKDFYTHLFEAGLLPLLDRLNGTRIAEKLALLVASEKMDPAEIRSQQEAGLAKTIDCAHRSSTFYQRFWRDRASGGLPSVHRALDGLPVLTKDDLRDSVNAFPVTGYRGGLVTTRTSGSTGSPMLFLRSLEQESWFWALRFRIWRWAGWHPGDPYLTINFNPRTAWKKRLQDKLFRCTYLTFNADNQKSQRIVEDLERKRIQHLNGFSSSLYVLARYMQDQRIPNPGVSGVTATGDSLYPPYRAAIESAFGVRVLDYYGAGGEGLHLASQCPLSGARYHLHPENAVVEILDGDGPVRPGARGRIVVTQLHNEAMPLIRYDLGDVAIAASDDRLCPCGRTLPLLESIEGRVPDLISLPDGAFLVMHFFVVMFKNLQSIHRYQIIQSHIDRILVRLVARAGCDRRSVEATVRKDIEAATRGSLTVDFEWAADIPLSGAGKRRLVISEVSRVKFARGDRPEEKASSQVTSVA